MKESGGDIAQIADLVASTPDGFSVLAGSASTFYAALCVGAAGGILALAALLPGRVRPAVRADRRRAGTTRRARCSASSLPLARLSRAGYGVPGLKAALKLVGYRRRPAAAAARSVHRGGGHGAAETRWHIRGRSRMSLLPDIDRILLGPGPSLTAPRVMRAMAAPTVSHLDPLMLALLDDVRARLTRVFRAAEGSFAFAVSGTGTSGMETAVANLVEPRARACSVVVTGYFGDRLAQMCERYGATVTRLDVEWGRACDPDALRAALERGAGRHRRDGARGNVDRRAESGRASWRRSRASTVR